MTSWREELQTSLLQLFEQYGVHAGVGLTKRGVVIRSQDERLDARNLGDVYPLPAEVKEKHEGELNEEEMVEQIAKIVDVSLGWEDHGIFTLMLHLDYGGSGQGAGGYALDEPVRDADGKFLQQRGTAYGMEWIIRTMRACGVDDWKHVVGRTVIALREPSHNGRVLGIKPLPTERGEPFLFESTTTGRVENAAS